VPAEAIQVSIKDYAPPLCRPIPYIHDLSRAKRDFGFSTTPVEDWIQTTVDWYRDYYKGDDAKGYANRSIEIALANKWTEAQSNTIAQFSLE
jgi:hypothetical protein